MLPITQRLHYLCLTECTLLLRSLLCTLQYVLCYLCPPVLPEVVDLILHQLDAVPEALQVSL